MFNYQFSRSSAGEDYTAADTQSGMNGNDFLGSHHEESNASSTSSLSHGGGPMSPQPSTSAEVNIISYLD